MIAIHNFIFRIYCGLYIYIYIYNLKNQSICGCELNELTRAINKPSGTTIFAHFLTSQAQLAQLANEPNRAAPSWLGVKP